MDSNEFAQGQAQHYPVMAIGDTLVTQLLSGLPREHAQVMLGDLNTDGFGLLCSAVGQLSASVILAAATEESGGDTRHLQHVRVQAVTISSVFSALLQNVKAFGEGTHPLNQAEEEKSDAPESDGAL